LFKDSIEQHQFSGKTMISLLFSFILIFCLWVHINTWIMFAYEAHLFHMMKWQDRSFNYIEWPERQTYNKKSFHILYILTHEMHIWSKYSSHMTIFSVFLPSLFSGELFFHHYYYNWRRTKHLNVYIYIKWNS